VLVIVRMVPRERLVAMLDEAAAQGLFVLLEAFDAADLAIARELAVERAGRDEQVLMGLNCRDLESLQDRLFAPRGTARGVARRLAGSRRKRRDDCGRGDSSGGSRLSARAGRHEPACKAANPPRPCATLLEAGRAGIAP
jgi:hypothetical protein